MSLIRALGSLKFAVFLIASLAALLTVSTMMESLHDTPLAQRLFYRAGWFDGFLALIGVNILCATLTRLPFKRHHTGFVITHVGILTLLAGALLSRLLGVEGQMTLFEGEQKMRLLREGFTVTLEEGGKGMRVTLPESPKAYPFALPAPEGAAARAERFLPHAAEESTVDDGGPAANPAVRATLSSQALGLRESFVLVAHDPENAGSAETQIGPARFRLAAPGEAAAEAALVIRRRGTGDVFRVPLGAGLADRSLDGELSIARLEYFRRARVVEGALVDAPEGTLNPAVRVELVDRAGRREEHVKFMIFPEAPSVRGGREADLFGLDLAVEAGAEAGPGFTFVPGKDGWRYRAQSSKGTAEGALEPGRSVPTGWMDMTLEPERLIDKARITRQMRPARKGEEGAAAVEIALEKDGRTERFWLRHGRPRRLAGDGRYALEPVQSPLPFLLRLVDFRKEDYPGTDRAASFESDVVLTDPHKGVTLERTIGMNRPLEYAGFRVFQSSYIQDPQMGEASVFSIARNPGIPLIYAGSIIILAGVILLFWLHPFFNSNRDGGGQPL